VSTSFQTSKCRGCGREIVWGRTVEGKPIPLDPRPPIYLVTRQDGKMALCAQVREGKRDGVLSGHMVSHFATCPKAADFSGSRKEPTT